MISRQDVTRLASLESDDGILSVYIKLDPRLRDHRAQAVSKFKGALSRFLRDATAVQIDIATREQDKILAFLEGTAPSGRSMAIFSSQPAGVWEAIVLDVLIPTMVTADTTTNTGSLARVLTEYPRFVLAVVQRDRATIYSSQQRSATEEADIESDVHGQHDQGGWSQARFARHIELQVERHLKQVVDELQSLQDAEPINHLVLGGTTEVVSELVNQLPDPMANLVIGSFGVDFKHETESEILEKARVILRDFERSEEEELWFA